MHLLVAVVFIAKDVVDVEDIITILVIVAVVLHAFTGFCEHTPRIP